MVYSNKDMAKQRLLCCLKQDKHEQQRLWHQYRLQAALCNEWIVSARLGETTFSDEQIHMVASLFGRC